MQFSEFFSEQIVFAIFGLALSLVFSKSLYERSVKAMVALGAGIIFEKGQLPEGEGIITKSDILNMTLHRAIKREKLDRIKKSALCNLAISSALFFIAIFGLSFGSAGAPLSPFGVVWAMYLGCLFVYLSYFGFVAVSTKENWTGRNPMSLSRYNLLLSLGVFLIALHEALSQSGNLHTDWFLISGVVSIILITRLSRIPHINSIEGVGKETEENWSRYLVDGWREAIAYSVIFVSLTGLHYFFFPKIEGLLGPYVSAHPVRSAVPVLLVPYFFFSYRFIKEVGLANFFGYLFFIDIERLRSK